MSGNRWLFMTAGIALTFLLTTPAGAQQDDRESRRQTGEVVEVGDGELTWATGSDRRQTQRITSETEITIDGQPAELDELRHGDKIRVSLDSDDAVQAVEAQRAPQAEDRREQDRSDAAPRQRPERKARESRSRDREPRRDGRERRRDRDDDKATQDGSAWLGVLLPSDDEQDDEDGVRIERTYPSGPASRAGMRSGDVIREIDGTKVSSAEEVAEAIERQRPGDEVAFVVERDGSEKELTVTLGNRSDFFDELPGRADLEKLTERMQRMMGRRRGEFPPHAMMLEHHRRIAEQHERIEDMIRALADDVQSLREEVQALRDDTRGRNARRAE